MIDPIVAVVDGKIRKDFALFAEYCFRELNPTTDYMPNWYIRVMANQLWQAASGEGQRFIINLPPRHLKSLLASIALPAFLLGHNPATKIIVVTYAQDLSDKMSRQFRQVMQSQWYRRLFPGTRPVDKGTITEVSTSAGGFRLSTSVGGTLTGRGGDVIIIDDPQKPADAMSETVRASVLQWYGGTLVSRLDSKEKGNIIVVMQRLHEEDLSGFLLAQNGWRYLSLPAIAPADETFTYKAGPLQLSHVRREGDLLHPQRESLATIEQIRKDMGEATFSAQYQQMPLPPGGGIIKSKWFQYYDILPARFERTAASWDCASKGHERADYSACTVWGIKDEKYYLLHVFRDRLEYPALKSEVTRIAKQYRTKFILIEDTSAGIGLAQELRLSGAHKIVPVKPGINDKIVRADHQTSKFEAGKVLFPRSAGWLDDYIRELTGFPNTKYDDQVDSTIQFLDWIESKPKSIMRRCFEEQQRRQAEGRFMVSSYM